MSINVDCFGTARVPEANIVAAIRKVADMTPKGIITRLDLQKPVFAPTAAYGHFGRADQDFSWEKRDLVVQLQAAIG